jgi:hypothetical protein
MAVPSTQAVEGCKELIRLQGEEPRALNFLKPQVKLPLVPTRYSPPNNGTIMELVNQL